jgi:hypothetical protein
MALTPLGAGAAAGLAADAVIRVRNGHYFIAHIITELVFSFERFRDQFEHIPAAGLVTSAAAYAFFYVY